MANDVLQNGRICKATTNLCEKSGRETYLQIGKLTFTGTVSTLETAALILSGARTPGPGVDLNHGSGCMRDMRPKHSRRNAGERTTQVMESIASELTFLALEVCIPATANYDTIVMQVCGATCASK